MLEARSLPHNSRLVRVLPPPEGNIKRNTCYKDWVMNEMNTSPHGPFNCLDF